MAKEVIDLISSSPSPRRPSHQVTARIPPRRQTRPNTTNVPGQVRGPAAVNLAVVQDEFDTTGDLDDPPSSFVGAPVNTTRRSATGTGRYGSGVRPPLPDGIEFLSDDFDTTEDLSDPILVESAGNKRRRITPSPVTDKAGVGAGPGVPTSLPSCRPPYGRRPPASTRIGSQNGAYSAGRSLNAVPSYSSDPFASSPPKSPACRILHTISNHNDSPDPFASSPRRSPKKGMGASRQVTAQPRAAAPIRQQSSDPFASSPNPQAKEGDQVFPRRNMPDIEMISSPTGPPVSSKSRRQDWDPISSSAPETHTGTSYPPNRGACSSMAIDIDSGSGDGSDDELPDIGTLARKPLRSRSHLRRSRSDIPPMSRARASNSTRQHNREARAAANEAEKERKKLERQEAKEAKARARERAAALTEVNKMRTDKKVSTREMIVDLPSALGCKVQVETLLEGLDVEHTTWDCPDNVVKWRRKVTSWFNEGVGHWEPIPRRTTVESHVAVILTADDFVNLALSDGGIAAHYSGIQEKLPGNQVIYLLEGLTPWMRKNRNIRNRQFTSGVRSQEASSSSTAGRRRNAAPEYVSEDIIEDALLELQVLDALIHHTAIPLETAQWLAVLTQHISTIPYKKQRNEALSAGFCMESGQVRTGDDSNDTYIRMLQEIARVTAPIAHGIAAEFGSVSKLVTGLASGGPGRLEGIRKTVNREGTLSDRTVGQAVSKRMHKVFTGRDEMSTDV